MSDYMFNTLAYWGSLLLVAVVWVVLALEIVSFVKELKKFFDTFTGGKGAGQDRSVHKEVRSQT
jgi:hypothetical protein